MTISLQHTPIRLNDHLCHRSCPADGIRSRLQHWEFSGHVVVHQGAALIGFLQGTVEDDAPGNTFQFHNGCAHHERDVPGACNRQDWLGIHASRIRDDRPGCGDRDVNGGIGIDERIAVKVDGKGPMRIAMYESRSILPISL